MSDWADIANLWWLKPRNPQGQSSLPAFQLGAQMQQQRIQNDINTKEMVLNQQYRLDHLAAQDRLTDVRLKEYNLKKKEADDEEADFQAMIPGIDALKRGVPATEPILKSYRGRQAWIAMQTEIGRQNVFKRGTAAQVEHDQGLAQMAIEVVASAQKTGPTNDSILASEILKATNGGKEWDDQSAIQIKAIYDRFNPTPSGMTAGTVTRKTPFGTTKYVAPPQEKIPTIAAELNSARELEITAAALEAEGNTEDAGQFRNDAKAIRSHVSPFARLPRADQDVIDNWTTREVDRINKQNEGLVPNSKNYIKPKTRQELLTEGKAYLDGLKEQSGTGPAKPKSAASNVLTREKATEFLKQAGGDKDKARQLARDAGYSF